MKNAVPQRLTVDVPEIDNYYLEGVYNLQGTVYDGSPYYKHIKQNRYLYYDKHCAAKHISSSPQWIFDESRPATDREYNLDLNSEDTIEKGLQCAYDGGYSAENNWINNILGSHTWDLYANGSWGNYKINISGNYVGHGFKYWAFEVTMNWDSRQTCIGGLKFSDSVFPISVSVDGGSSANSPNLLAKVVYLNGNNLNDQTQSWCISGKNIKIILEFENLELFTNYEYYAPQGDCRNAPQSWSILATNDQKKWIVWNRTYF